MKLYYSPGACSLSPHIVAREAGIPVELKKVDLKAKLVEGSADYLKTNGKGYVPALQMDDGQVLTEGAREGKFSEIKVEDVHGEFRLPSVWRMLFGDKKFRVENVDVQRVSVDFSDRRLPLDLRRVSFRVP